MAWKRGKGFRGPGKEEKRDLLASRSRVESTLSIEWKMQDRDHRSSKFSARGDSPLCREGRIGLFPSRESGKTNEGLLRRYFSGASRYLRADKSGRGPNKRFLGSNSSFSVLVLRTLPSPFSLRDSGIATPSRRLTLLKRQPAFSTGRRSPPILEFRGYLALFLRSRDLSWPRFSTSTRVSSARPFSRPLRVA